MLNNKPQKLEFDDNGRTLNDYVDLGGLDRLQLDDNDNDDDTDHWGQPVEHYDGRQMGAGEKCQCQRCASRQIALVAATRNTSATNWEEFYRCEGCGAEGSLRVEGPERRWTGDIDHPDVIQG